MPLSPAAITFLGRANSRWLFGLFSLWKLPSAWFAGVHVRSLTPARCVTAVPYGWRSQNPFSSIYFAAQAMAAELSTGALVMLAIEDAGVPFSMLIVDLHATFGKKAVALAEFTCEGGDAVFSAVAEARRTGEPQVITLETVGRMSDGTEVSRFRFTWSMKARNRAAALPAPNTPANLETPAQTG